MDILESLGITIRATYIPHRTPLGQSPTLRWKVSVMRHGREFHATEYSAGCAHSPEYKKMGHTTAAVVQECETGIVCGMQYRQVPPPDAADVVHCLLTDQTDETFESWCGEFGYDTDSRRAERMYQACRDTAAALRRAFSPDELDRLAAAFADY